MKSNRTKTDFVSHEISRLNNAVNTSQTSHDQATGSRYSKMAELACKLAEEDISRLIQEAKQLANSNRDSHHASVQRAFKKMPPKS